MGVSAAPGSRPDVSRKVSETETHINEILDSPAVKMLRQSLAGSGPCVSPGATAWLSRLSDLLGRDEAR